MSQRVILFLNYFSNVIASISLAKLSSLFSRSFFFASASIFLISLGIWKSQGLCLCRPLCRTGLNFPFGLFIVFSSKSFRLPIVFSSSAFLGGLMSSQMCYVRTVQVFIDWLVYLWTPSLPAADMRPVICQKTFSCLLVLRRRSYKLRP